MACRLVRSCCNRDGRRRLTRQLVLVVVGGQRFGGGRAAVAAVAPSEGARPRLCRQYYHNRLLRTPPAVIAARDWREVAEGTIDDSILALM